MQASYILDNVVLRSFIEKKKKKYLEWHELYPEI